MFNFKSFEMKKQLLIMFCVGILLTGCQTTDEKYSKLLIGDWEYIYTVEGIEYVENTSYFPNNKFKTIVHIKNQEQEDLILTGKWEIKEECICYTIESSNYEESISKGYNDCSKIKEITNEKCITESEGETNIMYKLPRDID